MDNNHQGVPHNGTGKRRQIDSAALTLALAQQARLDALAPPTSLTTTMGAIRLLGDLILDRKDRGWSDPMLVVLLREMGLEITAETLRVYRGRLKKERGGEGAGVPIVGQAATDVASSRPAPTEPAEPAIGSAASLAPTTRPANHPAPPNNDDDQPPIDRSIPFDDRV